MEEKTLSIIINELFKDDLKLSLDELTFFDNSFEKIGTSKNEYVIKEGQIEKYIYFIEKGILRYWAENINLREITFGFAFAGEFISSCLSLKEEIPSEFNIQTLEKCILWRIPRTKVVQNCASNLIFNKIARLVLEDALIHETKRKICLLKYKGADYYRQLVQSEKRLIKEIPLKYLASYLGITPQTLSRIRRQIINIPNLKKINIKAKSPKINFV